MDPVEILGLKADLLVEGVRADAGALEGVGEVYKEQNHGLFGWDFEDHVGTKLPDDFILPGGTVVQFRKNGRSPFEVRKNGSGLTLLRGEEELCRVDWLPRPAFYDEKTGASNRMVRIGQIGGEDCLFFCYQNHCSYFSRKRQCLFCNLVSTSETYSSVLRKKEVGEIGEVAAAAFSEGTARHVLLTGGCFGHQREIDLVGSIISSISARTGLDRVPGTILPSPAVGKEDVLAYHDSGIQAIGFSMEIWDEAMYRAICPGKAGDVSHDEFIRGIRFAVEVFGEGNVYGVFVLGLESRSTFLDGVREITQLGANVVPFVWSPTPGSALEGHRAPYGEWYVETMFEAAEIISAADIPSGTENHCHRCDGNSLLHDALRLKGIE